MKYESKYTGEEIDAILGIAEAQKPLSKENVERVLNGNVISHSHDTILEKPLCDILNAETIEADVEQLIGADGTKNPFSGSGTQEDPYIIDSSLKWLLFHLSALNNDLNDPERKYYKLTVNCDLAGFQIPYPNNVDNTKEAHYSLDGTGHFISNFSLESMDTSISMFPYVGYYQGGENFDVPHVTVSVKNIGVKNASFTSTITKAFNGRMSLSGIAGAVISTDETHECLSNCYIDNVTFTLISNYNITVIVTPFVSIVVGVGKANNLYARNCHLRLNGGQQSDVSVVFTTLYLGSPQSPILLNAYADLEISGTYFPTDVSGAVSSELEGAYKNIFCHCNMPIRYTNSDVHCVDRNTLKTERVSTALGESFNFNPNVNDGYPYLAGQEVETRVYDGYVKKSEMESLFNQSSNDIFIVPASIGNLTSASTSEQIAVAIGGTNGFNAIKNAIRTLKRLIFYLEENGVVQWQDIGMKACGTGDIGEGVQGEVILLGLSDGSATSTTYIITYNPSNDTFSIQKQ